MSRSFDLVVGREPAKADGRIALCRGKTQGAKHVGRFGYAGRAGGTCGSSKPRLQRSKNVLRDEAVKSGIGIARMAAITNSAVDGDESMPTLEG